MALKVQSRVLELVKKILGGTEDRTPSWLMRPAFNEWGRYWSLVNEIYTNLTGLRLPNEMPARERRIVDCALKRPNGEKLIIEVDESQHFNRYRAKTLSFYPTDIGLGFDRSLWIEHSKAKKRLEGGGFARPKPPLSPERMDDISNGPSGMLLPIYFRRSTGSGRRFVLPISRFRIG